MDNQVLIAVITSTGTLIGILLPMSMKALNCQRKSAELLQAGLRASLKPQLQHLHERQYSLVKGKSTVWDSNTDHIFNEVYTVYKSLGGNGVIDNLKHDMDNWRDKYASEIYGKDRV